MVPYSIRAEFGRFGDEIDTYKDALERVTATAKFNKDTYEVINLIIAALEYHAEMCRKQGIHILGFGENKAQPFRDLSAALNQMLTLRSLYMENSEDKNIENQQKLTINLLDKLHSAVLSKVSRVAMEEPDTDVTEKIIEATPEENGAYKSLPEAMSVLAEEKEPLKRQDQKDYEDLNVKLDQEKKMLDNLLEEGGILSGFLPFKGSVAINHFFKARDLKGIDYSMFSFKGVEFSFNRRETIPPMFVFHDQTLVAFDLKKRRFKFGRKACSEYKSPQAIMEEKKTEILNHFKDSNLINITQYVESGYLYSKAYKGLYFLWLANPLLFNALGRFPENKTTLIWKDA